MLSFPLQDLSRNHFKWRTNLKNNLNLIKTMYEQKYQNLQLLSQTLKLYCLELMAVLLFYFI